MRERTISGQNSTVALVRFRVSESAELWRRRQELAELRRVLLAREQEAGELRAQIVSFEGRYMRQVGVLYRRLDEWEEKIVGLQEVAGRAEESAGDVVEVVEERGPQTTLPALRGIFRELVKLLHPDLAADAEDERRRTRLMAVANEAYAREDAAAIRRMLSGYDPVVMVASAESVREEEVRLMARIFQVRQDVEAVALEMEALQRSDSAKLRERTLEAARQGRDLLAEMAARVNGSIGLAMRRYELELSRKRRPAKGMKVESLVTAGDGA